MTLTEDIIMRYKDLTFRFKKGSIVKKESDATYILPPKKEKAKNTEESITEVQE